MNSIFGSEWDGTPISESLPHVDAPVGESCGHCGEAIAPGDSGIIMPLMNYEPGAPLASATATLTPWHRACHLRGIFGSVGHQLGKCSCHGRHEDDDPTLTKRQQAEAAVALFMRTKVGPR